MSGSGEEWRPFLSFFLFSLCAAVVLWPLRILKTLNTHICIFIWSFQPGPPYCIIVRILRKTNCNWIFLSCIVLFHSSFYLQIILFCAFWQISFFPKIIAIFAQILWGKLFYDSKWINCTYYVVHVLM